MRSILLLWLGGSSSGVGCSCRIGGNRAGIIRILLVSRFLGFGSWIRERVLYFLGETAAVVVEGVFATDEHSCGRVLL